MKKVPHYKPDTVIRRAECTAPIKKMIECIASRHGFKINLERMLGVSKRKRAEPFMDALETIDPNHKSLIMMELYWLNRIGATPEISGIMYGFVTSNGYEIPDVVRRAIFQDQVAWAYPLMSASQWEKLITITNIRRHSANDWTQLVLNGLNGALTFDTSDEGLAKIREEVCKTLFNAVGRAEDGCCSHYYDEKENCDYFRLDLLGYPHLKAILVKKHKVRRRHFRDMDEVDIQYNRNTNILSICSESDYATDNLIAQAWLIGVLGEEEAKKVFLDRPISNTFNLDFIKHNSAHLAVPENSILTSAQVVLANACKRGGVKKNILMKSDDIADDIHTMLTRTWSINNLCADDFYVTRIEILFSYPQADGKIGSVRCRFSDRKSNYLEAPEEVRGAIEELLIERKILNAAA